MDVAGALLPFTQVVRPELTIHVKEVLTQADGYADPQKSKHPIPEINEPNDRDDDRVSPNKVRDAVDVKYGSKKGSSA